MLGMDDIMQEEFVKKEKLRAKPQKILLEVDRREEGREVGGSQGYCGNLERFVFKWFIFKD